MIAAVGSLASASLGHSARPSAPRELTVFLRETPDGRAPKAPVVGVNPATDVLQVAFLSHVQRAGSPRRKQALYTYSRNAEEDLDAEELLDDLPFCGARGDLLPLDDGRTVVLAICSRSGGRPTDAKHLWVGVEGRPGFVEVDPSLNNVYEAWLAAASNGMWVLWRGDLAPSRLWAARLDRGLEKVGEPRVLLESSGDPLSLARHQIVPTEDDGLAVAWRSVGESGNPTLFVSTVGNDGEGAKTVPVFEDSSGARTTSFSLDRRGKNLMVAWIVVSRQGSVLHIREVSADLESASGEVRLLNAPDRGDLHAVRLSASAAGAMVSFLQPSSRGGHDLWVAMVPPDLSVGLGDRCLVATALPTLEHWLLKGRSGTLAVARTERPDGWFGYQPQLERLLESECSGSR